MLDEASLTQKERRNEVSMCYQSKLIIMLLSLRTQISVMRKRRGICKFDEVKKYFSGKFELELCMTVSSILS